MKRIRKYKATLHLRNSLVISKTKSTIRYLFYWAKREMRVERIEKKINLNWIERNIKHYLNYWKTKTLKKLEIQNKQNLLQNSFTLKLK